MICKADLYTVWPNVPSMYFVQDENGKLSEQQMNELLQSCIQSMSGTDSLPPIDK